MRIVDQLKDARILNEQKQKTADEQKAAGFVIHKFNGSNSSLISFLTWWSMSSYNIIVIHICCAGFKILDEQKDAAKAAKPPMSRKRKEIDSSDEDFCDEREGNGSEDD